MGFRANFQPDELRTIRETCFNFRAQLGQRFLARRARGADGERLLTARPIAVAFHTFDEDGNLHTASEIRCRSPLIIPRDGCAGVIKTDGRDKSRLVAAWAFVQASRLHYGSIAKAAR